MNKKRKTGILLILIGIGIPLVLFFFQEDGEIRIKNFLLKEIERNLSQSEIRAIEEKKELKKNSMSDFEKFMEERGAYRDKNGWKKEKWIIRGTKYLIPYKYSIGIGIIPVLVGIGMVIFSFFPKEAKSKKNN